MKKAIILLSGGLDSATVCAIAKNENYDLYAISFDYGQRHKIELKCAKELVKFFNIKEHKIAKIDLRIFGGSSLTDNNIGIPKNNLSNIKDKIPSTYVPARNTIFLSYALAYAEVTKAETIFIGVNAIDYSGYPDCRKEFIDAFEKMANLATAYSIDHKINGKKVSIKTPLISLSKKDIIKTGLSLNVDYSIAHSCYDPVNKNEKIFACGSCDSCLIRLNGFKDNNRLDPYPYCFYPTFKSNNQ
jgi:7-cyano-7-deazaguanine synthase